MHFAIIFLSVQRNVLSALCIEMLIALLGVFCSSGKFRQLGVLLSWLIINQHSNELISKERKYKLVLFLNESKSFYDEVVF